jgi:hypothetical protein
MFSSPSAGSRMNCAPPASGLKRQTLSTGTPANTVSISGCSGSTSTWIAFQPGCRVKVCCTVAAAAAPRPAQGERDQRQAGEVAGVVAS